MKIASVLATLSLPVCFYAGSIAAQQLQLSDVQHMLAAKVPSDVIAAKVRAAGQPFDLTADQIVELKKAGASDEVLRALIAPGPSSPAAPSPSQLEVPDGTEVKLRLKGPLSSATAVPDQRIEFEASEDVIVAGTAVIRKGAPAAGHVTASQAKKSFGRKGKLDFSIDTVTAADGQNFRLRTAKTASGADNYGTAGVVTILAGPFGVLVKGKDVEVPAGTEYTIYIDGDRKIGLPR